MSLLRKRLLSSFAGAICRRQVRAGRDAADELSIKAGRRPITCLAAAGGHCATKADSWS